MNSLYLSFLLVCLWAPVSIAEHNKRGVFEDVEMSVVYSASDVDAQMIITGSSDAPLQRVVVFGPKGVIPVKVRFKDGNRLGQADFQFDTPEPSLEELEKAYPAGQYAFFGKTVDGRLLVNKVELSYELLDAPHIIFPSNGDTGIPTSSLVVLWDQVQGAEAIRLELEDEETEVALKVDLSGDATGFTVPDHWLQSGTEYVLDIKAKGGNGNVTVTDLRFMTMQ